MPTAATTGTASKTREAKANASMPAIRFTRASGRHGESFDSVVRTMTSNEQDLGILEVPAYGYLGAIVLEVTAAGGSGGSGGTVTEDAPFNILKNIYLQEPNGSNIIIARTGYDLFLMNKFGGYNKGQGADPRALRSFSQVAAASGNFSFKLRIPVQINPNNALGALGNQNSAATFKIRATMGGIGDLLTGGTAPTTLPTVTINTYFEGWDQPEMQTGGMVNQTTPPALNTTQFWTRQDFVVNSGDFNVRTNRVGNFLRSSIFVFRSSNSRATGDTNFPSNVYLTLDTRPIYSNMRKTYWKDIMSERSGYGAAVGTTIPAADSANGLENGVFVFDYMNDGDGTYGNETNDDWQPTLASTRYELRGTFGGSGTLTWLTNDVAVAGNVWT